MQDEKIERGQRETQDSDWIEEEDKGPQEDIHFNIMSYPADTSLKGYKEQWDNEQLKIPDFQRKYVWDQPRASKLIESFLLGLTVPGVFLYKRKEKSNYLVIDGQQRIKTVIKFFKGTFKNRKFILKKVSPKWEGKAFEDLEDNDKFKLETTIMRATIIQQLDSDDNKSIYQIFERLNTGSVNLNPMEVRMCVSEGEFVDMITELNQNSCWRNILGKQEEHDRSKDKEFILRILALYDKGEEYTSPMKRFLDDYIQENKNTKNENIKKAFITAVQKASDIKEKPFHLHGKGLNFSAMDSILVALMKTQIENIEKSYNKLIKNDEYIKLIQRGQVSKPEVERRLKIAEEAFR